MSVDLALETLVMIDRASDRQRVPLKGLMECAGLLPNTHEDFTTGYSVTTASVITDAVALRVLNADHAFLPFTVDSGSDLGKLQARMLVARVCYAVPDYEYAYFGPEPSRGDRT